jgi:hypothetical protein
MFKKLIIILIISIGIGLELRAATIFIPGINDLPLMTGLILKSELPVVFATPAGRIIEVFATGKMPPSRVSSFYAKVLPQLGWQSNYLNEFQRDNELLKIEILSDILGRTVVRFFVVPN